MTTVTVAAARIKQSGAFDDFSADLQQQNASQMWNQLGQDATSYGMAGLGAGLAIPSSYYLLSRLKQLMKKPEKKEEPVRVPVKQSGVIDSAIEGIGTGLGNIFSGKTLHDASALPAYAPAVLGAGAAGVGLGVAGSSKLQKYLRKQMIAKEVEQAKQEYEEALAGQTKQAKQLHEDLDAIYDAYTEKRAGVEDMLGSGMGIGLAGLLGLGALGFGTGVSHGNSQQNRRLIEQAQKLRRRRKYLKQPMPVFAVPEEVEGEPEEPTPDKAAPSLY